MSDPKVFSLTRHTIPEFAKPFREYINNVYYRSHVFYSRATRRGADDIAAAWRLKTPPVLQCSVLSGPALRNDFLYYTSGGMEYC
jgi:hypothetical protein